MYPVIMKTSDSPSALLVDSIDEKVDTDRTREQVIAALRIAGFDIATTAPAIVAQLSSARDTSGQLLRDQLKDCIVLIIKKPKATSQVGGSSGTVSPPRAFPSGQDLLPVPVSMDEKDIELVMQGSNCTREQAMAALTKSKCDIVYAIMDLTEDDTYDPLKHGPFKNNQLDAQ